MTDTEYNFVRLPLVEKLILSYSVFRDEMLNADSPAPVDDLRSAESFGRALANYVRVNHVGCDCKTPQPRTIWVNSQTGEAGAMCLRCCGKVS